MDVINLSYPIETWIHHVDAEIRHPVVSLVKESENNENNAKAEVVNDTLVNKLLFHKI